MKKRLLLSFSLFFSLFLYAQKTIHDPNVEARKVSGFHSIEVSGGIDLYLSQGEESAAVSARDEEAKARIRTEVKEGVLKIWYDAKGMKIRFNDSRAIKVYVSFKTLKSLVVSGGSDAEVDGSLSMPELELIVSGGSDFNGKVDVTKLVIEQSGGSDLDISGKAGELIIDVSGGSDFEGYGLTTESCIVNASGGSDISITVNKELSAEASGASDINWKGSATVKKVKASGAGSVSHRS